MLTSGDVAEIAGLPLTTLARWIKSGIVESDAGGSGNYREWSLIEAVAIAYGERWRQAGCGPAMIGSVVKFICGLGERKLRAELKAGCRIVLPEPGRVHLMPAKDCSTLDLNATLLEVEMKIAEIQKRDRHQGPGRHRGLVRLQRV